ncbi:MAG: hypothetical protein HRT89_09280 [Lentisphaeria bacterium]|nr:hypothetical protein [Lentisphaeria bacterium]NQZ68251.1 hypothetical protein [Lentisphaeria bacterium]
MKLENVFIALVPSFFVAIIIGGFLGGFINCTGCDGILDRVFLGLIFIILTPLCGGMIPEDEGGGGPVLNMWPYIIFSWVILSSAIYYYLIKQSKTKIPKQ